MVSDADDLTPAGFRRLKQTPVEFDAVKQDLANCGQLVLARRRHFITQDLDSCADNGEKIREPVGGIFDQLGAFNPQVF